MDRSEDWLTLRVDGASRGNPGPAAIGVVVEDGGVREEIAEGIGYATNNAAEYRALIRGLEAARARGAERVRVFSDSQLLVRQLRGEYRIKDDHLARLAEQARRLMSAFAVVELHHVPREENAAADRLANAALDGEARRAAPGQGGREAAGAARREAAGPVRRLVVRVVDVFTDRPLAGNPAGVVPDADGLEEQEMQALARELGASETVFVLSPTPGGLSSAPGGVSPPTGGPAGAGRAGWRFRYFTPAREVPLCGHATLAAVHLLAAEGRIPVPGTGRLRLAVETGAGLRAVEVEAAPRPQAVGRAAEGEGGPGRVWLELAPPRFRPLGESLAELAAVLGLAPGELHPTLPPAVAYSGLWHLLVPVAAPDVLERLRPDGGRLAALNGALGVHTTHVYAAPPVPPVTSLVARDFAPVLGIAEDPQTGTANGALAAWLAVRGWLATAAGSPRPAAAEGRHQGQAGDGLPAEGRLTVVQGKQLGRPGRVEVRVEAGAVVEGAVEGDVPSLRVWVGGRAVVSLRGEIYLPREAGER